MENLAFGKQPGAENGILTHLSKRSRLCLYRIICLKCREGGRRWRMRDRLSLKNMSLSIVYDIWDLARRQDAQRRLTSVKAEVIVWYAVRVVVEGACKTVVV